MKAVVFEEFGGPEVLKCVDLPKPVPAPGQVLVKTVSAGVCKADWRVRTGNSQWLTSPFPVTVGYESAGVVEALGEGVTAALRLLDERKAQYRAAGTPYYQPWLVILTDGAATDDTARATSAIASAAISLSSLNCSAADCTVTAVPHSEGMPYLRRYTIARSFIHEPNTAPAAPQSCFH